MVGVVNAPVIPELERLKQEDCDFKVRLGYSGGLSIKEGRQNLVRKVVALPSSGWKRTRAVSHGIMANGLTGEFRYIYWESPMHILPSGEDCLVFN